MGPWLLPGKRHDSFCIRLLAWPCSLTSETHEGKSEQPTTAVSTSPAERLHDKGWLADLGTARTEDGNCTTSTGNGTEQSIDSDRTGNEVTCYIGVQVYSPCHSRERVGPPVITVSSDSVGPYGGLSRQFGTRSSLTGGRARILSRSISHTRKHALTAWPQNNCSMSSGSVACSMSSGSVGDAIRT